MIREIKEKIFVADGMIRIANQVRDNNGTWEKQGTGYGYGATVAATIAEEIKTLNRFGWTVLDYEGGDTIEAWKVF